MVWYRVGGKLKRTIYRCTEVNPEGYFVGIMDDEEFAQQVCDALNLEENGTTRVPEWVKRAAPGDQTGGQRGAS